MNCNVEQYVPVRRSEKRISPLSHSSKQGGCTNYTNRDLSKWPLIYQEKKHALNYIINVKDELSRITAFALPVARSQMYLILGRDFANLFSSANMFFSCSTIPINSRKLEMVFGELIYSVLSIFSVHSNIYFSL